VVHAVGGEPVSAAISLIYRENTGNLSEICSFSEI